MLHLTTDIGSQLREKQFACVQGQDYSLRGNFSEIIKLTKSWEFMEKDIYYGNEGSATRYRRYSDFNYNPQSKRLTRLDHRPYFQSEEMNSYVGGKTRHFGDVTDEMLSNPIILYLVQTDFEVYKEILPKELWEAEWQCQIHQIRIEIEPGKETEITPEGIHSDGYPFSAVHFWGKENITGAESKLYTQDEEEIASLMFEQVLDTIYFMDRDMKHYITPAKTAVNDKAGYRQIIAISFSIPGSEYDTVR